MGHTSHLIMIIPFLVPATTNYHSVFPCVPTHPDMGGNWDNKIFLKNKKSIMLRKKFCINYEAEVGDHFF